MCRNIIFERVAFKLHKLSSAASPCELMLVSFLSIDKFLDYNMVIARYLQLLKQLYQNNIYTVDLGVLQCSLYI